MQTYRKIGSFNYKTTSFNTHSDSVKSLDFDNSKYQSSNIRVMCKNILYLIGIPIEIANKDTLIKKEYLGQYGSIQKIIINKNGYFKNESDYPTYSSYITYSSQIEASLALLVLNNSINIATLFSKGQNALIKTVIIYMKLLIKMILL